MGLSGLVGAGAQDALMQQLAMQLRQQALAEQQREAMAREALMQQENARRAAEDAAQREQMQFVQKRLTEQDARAANAEQREVQAQQVAQNRASDMANVMQMPGLTNEQRLAEVTGIGTRGGEIGAIDLLKLNTPAPKKTRTVTMRGPKGEPINAMVPEDVAVEEYRAPQAPPAPRQPSFVTMPDGRVVDVMGVAPEGATPYRQPVRTQLTPAEAAVQTRMLRNQYQRDTATTRDIQRQSEMMRAGMDAARRGDLAAGSQAVLVTFQKILDPTSVVRESEYARSSAGQALLARMEGAADRLMRGGAGVPLEELQKFADLANTFVQNAVEREDAVRQHYTDMATEFGLNPELVVGKPPSAPPAPSDGGAGAGAPADPLGIRRPR